MLCWPSLPASVNRMIMMGLSLVSTSHSERSKQDRSSVRAPAAVLFDIWMLLGNKWVMLARKHRFNKLKQRFDISPYPWRGFHFIFGGRRDSHSGSKAFPSKSHWHTKGTVEMQLCFRLASLARLKQKISIAMRGARVHNGENWRCPRKLRT